MPKAVICDRTATAAPPAAWAAARVAARAGTVTDTVVTAAASSCSF